MTIIEQIPNMYVGLEKNSIDGQEKTIDYLQVFCYLVLDIPNDVSLGYKTTFPRIVFYIWPSTISQGASSEFGSKSLVGGPSFVMRLSL
jgi:hypothetical protein